MTIFHYTITCTARTLLRAEREMSVRALHNPVIKGKTDKIFRKKNAAFLLKTKVHVRISNKDLQHGKCFNVVQE